MTSFVNKVLNTYNYYVYDMADPRLKNYFLLSSPLPIFALTGLYLYFCTSLGPRYMRDRKPYDLKKVILLYNAFQVILSTYLTVRGFMYIMSDKFNLTCGTVDYSNHPTSVQAAYIGLCYFYSKVIEFLDTIFFVLRKKNNQISFLHVYHHSVMALSIWIGAKYFSGGHGAMMVTLNSFVHVIMYSYYLLAGLGPQYQKYLWWKKHVTILQLVQFVIIFIHSAYPLFTDCSYPRMIHVFSVANSLLFINLFGRFFIENYTKSSDKNGVANGIQNGGVKCSQNCENGHEIITNGHKKYDVNIARETLKDR